MKQEDVFSRVKAVIHKQMGVAKERIKPEATFIEDLGADSLDTVELLMQVEEEFDIQIPEADALRLTSVQSVIDYVVSRPSGSTMATAC